METTSKAYFLIALMILTVGLATLAPAEGSSSRSDSSEKPDEIEWISLDTGLVLAKADDKHVFINFTTSWCGFCKRMDKTTFADSEVIEMMRDNFITVKVDGDGKDTLNIDGYKITERNLTRAEFGVASYPTYWFLSPEGEKLGMIKGYKFKQQLMPYLTYVAERQYDTTDAGQGESEKAEKK